MGACIGKCESFAKSRKAHRSPRGEAQRSKTVVVYQQYSKLKHQNTPDIVRAMPNAPKKGAGYRIVLDKDPDAGLQTDGDDKGGSITEGFDLVGL